jgi:shikimate dehydrogenase
MSTSPLPPQKQMTGMFGHPVAEDPIDRMFDAVYAHYGLHWQFWKWDVASGADVAADIAGVRALGFAGACITAPYRVASIPCLDEVDADVRAIGAANYLTIEAGRLIGHNNDGKGVVKATEKVTPIKGGRVAMLGAGGAGRAVAVELAWAGAAHLTIITRRESQGVEVAELVTRASGVPAAWLPWVGEVAIPEGTRILMNATHRGGARGHRRYRRCVTSAALVSAPGFSSRRIERCSGSKRITGRCVLRLTLFSTASMDRRTRESAE